MNWTR